MTTNYEPFDLTTWKRTHPKWIHNASPKEQELFYELTAEQKQDIVNIHRMAKTLHRIAENACNGWPKEVAEYRDGKMYRYGVENETWRKADEAKEMRYEFRIKDIATRNGWIVDFQGDPRGAVVKLQINGRDMTNLIFA